jgi:subtilase family serine protease
MSIKSQWPALAAMLVAGAICPAARAELKTLPGHVPAVVAQATPLGFVAATNGMNLAIGLPLRDPAGLADFLAQVYNPASPLFHHFLTPEELTARFGPTEEDYETVKNFARTNGLAVTRTYGNRLLLDVRGPASGVEQAFHVALRTYRHPTEARDFFAPAANPAVDASLPIADVSGLENYTRPHPNLHRAVAAAAVPKSGSAPDGSSYFGSDFRSAYVPGTMLNGSGQTVGLVQFEGFYASDVEGYAALAGGGRTNIAIQTVLLDGFSGVPNSTDTNGIAEVSLDIEMSMSMAPGLSQIVVFEGNQDNFIPNDVLNAMAGDPGIKNLSSSWSWTGGPSATTDSIFETMAAQGQCYFNASGDSDAFPAGFVDEADQTTTPSSSPYVVEVGGTTLSTTGPGGAYASETVWNWGFVPGDGRYIGTSGGVSSYYPIPSWQSGVNSFLNNGGSSTRRNIPDVALTADGVYVMFCQTNGTFGGTSCAAPLWAGFLALANQQASLSGKPPVGFINPAVYELANESLYASVFHDITNGNNTWAYSPAAFFAKPGYDLCTGVGTPAGTNLISALVNPDSLLVAPSGGFSTFSLAGGPFNISSQALYLTNVGTASLNWSIINTSVWLNVSKTSGPLPVGAGRPVVVTVNGAANNLGPGTYTANLWFTNTTSHVAHARFITLVVSESLVLNGGFETGDFTDWTLFGDTVNGNYILNAVEGPNPNYDPVHSGNYGAFLGDTNLAILYQTLPTSASREYLLSFWLENPASGSGQFFEVNWNTNGLATNTIYTLVNPPKFGWINLNFDVTATGPGTTLQFAAENPPNYFGLDDISVVPIPQPALSAVGVASNDVAFTWNTLANASYVVQYTANLAPANWLNVGGAIQAGTNTLKFVDTNAFQTSPQRFYRVSISP